MLINVISTNTEIGNKRKENLIPILTKNNLTFNMIDNFTTELGYDALMLRIKLLVKDNYDKDYFIFAEDDLTLTDNFKTYKLYNLIKYGLDNKIGAAFTGAHGVYNLSKTSDNKIFGIGGGKGCQLMVIFKPLYDRLLNTSSMNNIDLVLSLFSCYSKIILTLPFLSGQLKNEPSLINPDKKFTVGDLFDKSEKELIEISKTL